MAWNPLGQSKPNINASNKKPSAKAGRQNLGNLVDYASSIIGLPETGLSEKIAGGPTVNSGGAKAYAPTNTNNNNNFDWNNYQNQVNTLSAQNGGYSSGGGGGGGGGDFSAPTPYYDQQSGQTFGSYGDFEGAINSAYGEANNILGQQEQNIRAGEQDLYTQATSPFDAQRPQLDLALQEGQQQVEAGKQGVRKDEANALSEARRLYNELSQGSFQRFGGSSSAGEFANSILGREFQRNAGKAADTAGQNIQKLVEKGIQIKQNYDTQLQSLEQQKAGALAQARDVFRQRLDQINNTRLGLSENKAQLKLQALQTLRSEAMQIAQQHEQFKQSLMLQSQTADLNLRNAIQSYRASNGQPVDLAQIQSGTYSQYGNAGTTANTGVYQGGLQTGARKYNVMTGQWE